MHKQPHKPRNESLKVNMMGQIADRFIPAYNGHRTKVFITECFERFAFYHIFKILT